MPTGQKTGGRTKGTKNRANAARQIEAAALGLTPLDYMLKVLRDEAEDPRRRDWAAGAAAPYCHAKLASVEVGNKPGEKFIVQMESGDGGLL